MQGLEELEFSNRIVHRIERLSILIERGEYEELANIINAMKSEKRSLDHELLDSAVCLCAACAQSAKVTETKGAQYTNTLRRHCALSEQLWELCLSLEAFGQEDGPQEDGDADALGPNDSSADLASGIGFDQGGRQSFLARAATALLGRTKTTHPTDARGPHPDASGIVSSVSDLTPQAAESAHAMSIYFLGPFRVCVDGAFVRRWPNGKSKMVFKYLAAHRDRPIAKECLMETFWPNASPESARNSLNVAIYNVRQALRQKPTSCPYVLYSEDKYFLNDEMSIWIDLDEFLRHWRKAQDLENGGDMGASVRELQAADALYDGDFLEEDRFEDWIFPIREEFRDKYRRTLIKLNNHHLEQQNDDQAIELGQKLVRLDPCDEAAHQQLMTCYWRAGQPHLALRQYNRCIEALTRELDVDPDPATIELFDKIRQRTAV